MQGCNISKQTEIQIDVNGLSQVFELPEKVYVFIHHTRSVFFPNDEVSMSNGTTNFSSVNDVK